jgi:osmoprotectant transport system ATP-binding protein
MLQSSVGMAVVVDRRGKYLGCCSIQSLASLIISDGGGSSSS